MTVTPTSDDDRIKELEARLAQLEADKTQASSSPPPSAATPAALKPKPTGMNPVLAFIIAAIVGSFAARFLILTFMTLIVVARGEPINDLVAVLIELALTIIIGIWIYRRLRYSQAAKSQEANQAKTLANQSHDFETWMGKHGLAFGGIVLVTLGIAYLLLISLQFLGPAGKIILGVITGLILISLSHFWLNKAVPRFGQIVFAGGAAIIYYTLYAMHFVANTRILDNQFLDLIILTLVAIAVAIYTVKVYRTELTSLLGIVLLYLTFSLSGWAGLTPFAFLIVTLAAVVLAWRYQWPITLLGAMILAYLSHLQFVGDRALTQLFLTNGFDPSAYDTIMLSFYYLLFTLPVFSFTQHKFGGISAAILIIVANTLFYTLILGDILTKAYDKNGEIVLWIGVAVINLYWLYLAYRRAHMDIANTTGVITNIAILALIPVLFESTDTLIWGWLLVGSGLTAIGLVTTSLIFVGSGLIGLVFASVEYWSQALSLGDQHISFAILGLVLAMLTLVLGQVTRAHDELPKLIQKIIHSSLTFIGLFTILVVLSNHIDAQLVTLSWGISGIVALLVGFSLKDRILRLLAMLMLGLTLT